MDGWPQVLKGDVGAFRIEVKIWPREPEEHQQPSPPPLAVRRGQANALDAEIYALLSPRSEIKKDVIIRQTRNEGRGHLVTSSLASLERQGRAKRGHMKGYWLRAD